jgi:hypothetical protein
MPDWLGCQRRLDVTGGATLARRRPRCRSSIHAATGAALADRVCARACLTNQSLPLREALLDAGSKLGPAVGSRELPTTLFYDARGWQVDAHFGVLNAAALESRLPRLGTTQ